MYRLIKGVNHEIFILTWGTDVEMQMLYTRLLCVRLCEKDDEKPHTEDEGERERERARERERERERER